MNDIDIGGYDWSLWNSMTWTAQCSWVFRSIVQINMLYGMGCTSLYFEFVQSDCNSTMGWQLQVVKVKELQQRCMFWQHHSNSSRAHPAHGEASNLPCKSSWSHTFLQGPLSLLTSDKRSQYIAALSNCPKLSDGPLGSPLHAKRLMQ